MRLRIKVAAFVIFELQRSKNIIINDIIAS